MRKILPTTFSILCIDQIIKIIVINYLSLNISTPVISNFFSLTYVQNEGAAFSTFLGGRIFLILVSLFSLFFIYYYFIKNQKMTKFKIFLNSLLIGGVLGNMIDRIFRGYVVDYLDFSLLEYHFPIFNFADICIVISCFILLYLTLKEDSNENKSSNRK